MPEKKENQTRTLKLNRVNSGLIELKEVNLLKGFPFHRVCKFCGIDEGKAIESYDYFKSSPIFKIVKHFGKTFRIEDPEAERLKIHSYICFNCIKQLAKLIK